VSEPRVIKKYPNRRLYDTEISSYITLEDVRQLVLEGVEFSVQDAKTKRDITRSILLQIILEREEDGEPIFSEPVLKEIIRFYGDSLQGMMTSYLEKSLKLFAEQQDHWRSSMANVSMGDPLAIMRDVAERNLAMWKEMQDGLLGGAMPGGTSRSRKGKRESDDS